MNIKNKILSLTPLLLLSGCTSNGANAGFFDDYGELKNLYNTGLTDNKTNTNIGALTTNLSNLFGQSLGAIAFSWGGLLFISILVLIISIVRYGQSGDSPQRRQQAKKDLMLSIILIACVGGLPFIISLLFELYSFAQAIF